MGKELRSQSPEGRSRIAWQDSRSGAITPLGNEPLLDSAVANAQETAVCTVVVSKTYDTIISEATVVTIFDLAMCAGLTIAGPAGANYRIEYRPAVSDEANWMTLTNVTLGAGPLLFFDSGSGKLDLRFYRAIRTD